MDEDDEEALRAAVLQSMLKRQKAGSESAGRVDESTSAPVPSTHQPQASDQLHRYNGHAAEASHYQASFPAAGARLYLPPPVPYAAQFYPQPQMLHFDPYAGHGQRTYYTGAASFHRPNRFHMHRHPQRQSFHPQNHVYTHAPPQFVNYYPPPDRNHGLRPEKRNGSTAAPVVEKKADSPEEKEKRLPGRFSRIDRSDSESEEDDRLDEFIDSDLDEDIQKVDSESENAVTPVTLITSSESRVRQDPDEKQALGAVDSNEAERGNYTKTSDCLSDLQVPDSDAITFGVDDDDDDFESTLNHILKDKSDVSESRETVTACPSDTRTEKSVTPEIKEQANELVDAPKASPNVQSVNAEPAATAAEPPVPNLTRKTIRLKPQANDADALERRKRKFGLPDDVPVRTGPLLSTVKQVIHSPQKGSKGSGPETSYSTGNPIEPVSVSNKKMRSFVVRKL